MPSHQERIRRNCPEMNCDHTWMYKESSNVAPFIEKDGTRTTISICINCGIKDEYNRPQDKFELELKKFFVE